MTETVHVERLTEAAQVAVDAMDTAIFALAATPATSGRMNVSTLRPAVEGLREAHQALKAALVPIPVVRGVRWGRMVDAGMKSGLTREASEDHADKYALRIASKLTAEEAAHEYATALAREFARSSEEGR